MSGHNPRNERIKREYFQFLQHARHQSEPTVDAAAKALDRFEVYTNHRDFRQFRREQAMGFKQHLAEQRGERSGEKLSKATLHSALTNLKRFFEWLALQPGYKSRLEYSHAEYFSLSSKDARVATTRHEQRAPTVQQIQYVISLMPSATEIDLRNRALIAFTLVTGARDSAIASMKLKHVDLVQSRIYQDARQVKTKFSKTFWTYFFPVGTEICRIFVEWVTFLRETKLWGDDDPLFPATRVGLGNTRQFEVSGMKREHWRNASPIRAIFRKAFKKAGLPYFNPHSFRNTLVQLGEKSCKSAEAFKALSQNLGHESPLTTFGSYGQVSCVRQGEIIRELVTPQQSARTEFQELADAVARSLIKSGLVPVARI